ncbi:MAG: rRNA pseudouridine synthase [Rhodospirillales bacterium]|nr:rRNA pseudouridine synthase [Rhodospirillales bacterium]
MTQDNHKGERIAKRIARAGHCSRRQAEALIAEGRVSLNGKILETPACVVTAPDVIQIDGKILADKEPTRLFLYHKPAGLVTTARDEKGRKTVFDALPPDLPRVVSVGRLDLNTEGLLLLTNDGELSRHLELPSNGWKRRYRVRAYGHPDVKALEALSKGMTIEGVHYAPIDATVETMRGDNCWIAMGLQEGKNREIRKVLEHLGLKVNRLIRVAYGPFQLGNLAEGAVREMPARTMREQISGFFK